MLSTFYYLSILIKNSLLHDSRLIVSYSNYDNKIDTNEKLNIPSSYEG